MATVLLIRKMETPNRIRMMATEIYATRTFTLESMLATRSDFFTLRTPSRLPANRTRSCWVVESDFPPIRLISTLSSRVFM